MFCIVAFFDIAQAYFLLDRSQAGEERKQNWLKQNLAVKGGCLDDVASVVSIPFI